MPLSWALLASLILAALGYLIGRNRASASAGSDVRQLHSRPVYHGANVALMTFVPAAAIYLLAGILRMSGQLVAESAGMISLMVLAGAVVGLVMGLTRIKASFMTRNAVERIILGILIFCSMIAIATTAGIVLSLIFETGHFFQRYSWHEFFFGTQWTPRFDGNSRLGMLPLLWARSTSPQSRCWWPCRSGCSPRSIYRNTPAPASAALPSPWSSCWPGFPPSSMACSR